MSVPSPESPISNGAILGDRIRMIEHSSDKKVFIKSLATRGWYGGLSRSAARIINILDAMGKEIILLETVGVGQTEVSVMNFAHSTVLVLVPEMGDYVQTIKAGVLEIGDIFVINKKSEIGFSYVDQTFERPFSFLEVAVAVYAENQKQNWQHFEFSKKSRAYN